MSKIFERLECVKVSNYCDTTGPVTVEINSIVEPPTYTQYDLYSYSVKLSIGGSGLVRGTHELLALKRSIARQISYVIYEEFKTPLLKLEEALWNRDLDVAKAILGEVYREMFHN